MKIKPGVIKLVGEIHKKSGIEKVGKKGTPKLTIVIVSDKDGDYPNYYPVDFFKNKIDWASNFEVGDEVRIRGILNGRLWKKDDEEFYFLGVTGFSIKRADEPEKTQEDDDGDGGGDSKTYDYDDAKENMRKKPQTEDDDDDLPF